MKRLNLSRYALSIGGAAALLAGCGGSQPPINPPGAMPQGATGRSASSAYRVLYRFERSSRHRDGGHPVAPLVSVDGTLYGTTFGGTHDNGTVFRISSRGIFKTLYKFRGGEYDGAHPDASLVDVGGTLYGTTFGGGQTNSKLGCGYVGYACGTVFAITTSGTEKVLYYFKGYPDDGNSPAGGLLYVNGLLYGTTPIGGSSKCGTVYTITTSGNEKVLYNFGSGAGCFPHGNLIDVNGTLYGTTYFGGGSSGRGTVYSITTKGSVKLLHSFDGGSDGDGPYAGLIDVNGTLYGTTFSGGGSGCVIGCGTVYAITTTGKERIIHSFGGSDGANPSAGLIGVNGTLYGTTTFGGNSKACVNNYDPEVSGCGTVFGVSVSGAETVLHNFADGRDGASPMAALFDLHGTLYGTAEYKDGFHCNGSFCLAPSGYGTVFALTP